MSNEPSKQVNELMYAAGWYFDSRDELEDGILYSPGWAHRSETKFAEAREAVRAVFDQACAERDAEIEKLNSALQAALIIEQDTVISKDAEIANERLLLNGLRSVNVGLCEQIRQKDAEIAKLKTDLQDADRHVGNLLLKNAELVQLREQNAALCALLERVPHIIENSGGNWVKHMPEMSYNYCPRCAYEATKEKKT